MVMSDEEHQELIKELERQAAEGANHLLRQLQKEPVMRLARLHALGVVLGMISQSIDDAPVNRRRHPEAQLWNRCAKPAEEGGEVIKALIGVTAGNPRKGANHTLDDVREELLDTAVSALCAWEHLDGNRGHVIDEFLRFIYERRLGRMTDPVTGKLRAELAEDPVGPDYQWDDRPQRTDPHAAIRREAAIPPLPDSAPFPWEVRPGGTAKTGVPPATGEVRLSFDDLKPEFRKKLSQLQRNHAERAHDLANDAPDPGLSEPRPGS